VLEHVPAYRDALLEIARCLRPGGRLLLTAPFHFHKQDTVIRASVRRDGSLEHHLPPVYHGDPINPEGALCFNDFGWDLIEAVRNAGFPDVGVHVFTAPAYGYLGLQYAILGTRQPTPRHLRTNHPASRSADRTTPTDHAPITESGEVWIQRATRLLQDGQLHSAIIAARHAVRLLPQSPDAIRLLGRTLCEQHAWAEAAQAYQQLTRLLPDDPAAWQARLDCARKAGHSVLTDLILEELQERHPEWNPQLWTDPAALDPSPVTPTPSDNIPHAEPEEAVLDVEGRP